MGRGEGAVGVSGYGTCYCCILAVTYCLYCTGTVKPYERASNENVTQPPSEEFLSVSSVIGIEFCYVQK